MLLPAIPVSSTARAATVDGLPTLPTDLVNIVTSYAADFDFEALYCADLVFDETGRLTNPEIRQLYKEAFVSSDCNFICKSVLMNKVFSIFRPSGDLAADRQQQEVRAIFGEIAKSGYRVMFDGVSLRNQRIESVDWSGISLRNADLSFTMLTNVDMTRADLRNTRIEAGQWDNVTLDGADMSGVVFCPDDDPLAWNPA